MGMGNVSGVADKSNLYLNLAIKYFERADKANSPALKAKFRELAVEYRDQALRLMALQSDAEPVATARNIHEIARPRPLLRPLASRPPSSHDTDHAQLNSRTRN